MVTTALLGLTLALGPLVTPLVAGGSGAGQDAQEWTGSSRGEARRGAHGAAEEVRSGHQPCAQRKLTCSAGVGPPG